MRNAGVVVLIVRVVVAGPARASARRKRPTAARPRAASVEHPVLAARTEYWGARLPQRRIPRRLRRYLGCILHGLRRRTTLEVEAWKPEREVELRVADAGAVPVDQGGLAICAETQVVAAHVEMTQSVSLQQRASCAVRRSKSGETAASYDAGAVSGTGIPGLEASAPEDITAAPSCQR
jgi:hypothetical protein